ncbi:FAD-binding protein [Apiospora arundinis]|uniref:FAD-binding protein n=1 Tax=Apiospora arundinis TaxID=335852 RepID=A0ABR2JIR6_9PEZI
MVREMRGLLRRRRFLLELVYANYADNSQSPYKSWGADSVSKLQAASRKYDPEGVFQKRVPGGFKVF